MKSKAIQKFRSKVILSLLAVSCLAIQKSVAQSSSINLGLAIGANYGNLSSNVGSWSGTVGEQASGNLEWRYNHKFGIAAEAQYITLTTNSNYSDSLIYYGFVDRTNFKTQLTVNFLQTSLLFKYYIELGSDPITPYDNPNGSGDYLTFFIGPYFSFVGTSPSNTGHIKNTLHYDTARSDASDIVTDSLLTKTPVNATNTSDGLALSVYGATVGAGVNLKLSQGLELTFDIRYSRDLVTLDNPLETTNSKTKVVTNYGFLGQREIVSSGTTGGIQYTDANAFSNFMCFNVGLNIRLFQLGGGQ